MGVKIKLRLMKKNYAAHPGIGFLTKSISKPNGYATESRQGGSKISNIRPNYQRRRSNEALNVIFQKYKSRNAQSH